MNLKNITTHFLKYSGSKVLIKTLGFWMISELHNWEIILEDLSTTQITSNMEIYLLP